MCFRTLSGLALGLFAFAGMAQASAYDSEVMADRPVLYLKLSAVQGSQKETDRSGLGHSARYVGSPKKTTLPNGDWATVFDGATEYVEVASARDLSVSRGKALTLEAWIRPDTLQFSHDEADGYVHFAGKGETGEHEYVLRMYSRSNSANRPNRISGYAFNPEGGQGSGSYFQDVLQAGQWIHVAVVLDARASKQNVSIFKNGVLRKTTPLSQFDVKPEAGQAPLRIATRDLRSFFRGAVGKFAVFGHALSEARLKAHYRQMVP